MALNVRHSREHRLAGIWKGEWPRLAGFPTQWGATFFEKGRDSETPAATEVLIGLQGLSTGAYVSHASESWAKAKLGGTYE